MRISLALALLVFSGCRDLRCEAVCQLRRNWERIAPRYEEWIESDPATAGDSAAREARRALARETTRLLEDMAEECSP